YLQKIATETAKQRERLRENFAIAGGAFGGLGSVAAGLAFLLKLNQAGIVSMSTLLGVGALYLSARAAASYVQLRRQSRMVEKSSLLVNLVSRSARRQESK